MVREITAADRQLYTKLASEFYSTDAVLYNIPASHIEATFNEMMRSSEYAEGFILETGGEAAGYALLAKTFSQEAGGIVLWIEELYVRSEYRSKGLGSEFFAFLEQNRPAARYRLEIEPENERAADLYARRGFVSLPYCQMIKDTKMKKEG